MHAKSRQLCPTLCTLWTVAHQAPLSMGFSRQQHWSGLPCPSPWDLPDPGIKLTSLASLVLAGRFFTTERPRKPEIWVEHLQWKKNITLDSSVWCDGAELSSKISSAALSKYSVPLSSSPLSQENRQIMSILEAFKWGNILEGLKCNEYSIMAVAFSFQKTNWFKFSSLS